MSGERHHRWWQQWGPTWGDQEWMALYAGVCQENVITGGGSNESQLGETRSDWHCTRSDLFLARVDCSRRVGVAHNHRWWQQWGPTWGDQGNIRRHWQETKKPKQQEKILALLVWCEVWSIWLGCGHVSMIWGEIIWEVLINSKIKIRVKVNPSEYEYRNIGGT